MFTNHWQGPGGNGDDRYATKLFDLDFDQRHVYGLERTSNRITLTVDGEVMGTFTGNIPSQKCGLVQIESTAGSGTTVRVLLPRHERAAPTLETQAAVTVQERIGAGAAVLLVDDEAAVRGPAAERLRELDYQVIEAADGPAALGLLAEGGTRVDLLVTDVGLPNGMNGRQVAEAAREQRPGLPVLFITGYAGTTLPPGIEVIDKPFELDTLVRRVQKLREAGLRTDEKSPGA